ncbi:MAG TPA: hypothetical protein VMZ91_03850 [Candidatus Paceibacterota bacterium]|nr:hypothetical protein [Candidatus Paceibacterota bacterium]
MSKPLRIILLIGNFGLLVLLLIILVINRNDSEGVFFFTILSILVVLSVLNIYFIRETYHGSFSLYLKRKKLEEEIKIQEAKNKLKELQKE